MSRCRNHYINICGSGSTIGPNYRQDFNDGTILYNDGGYTVIIKYGDVNIFINSKCYHESHKPMASATSMDDAWDIIKPFISVRNMIEMISFIAESYKEIGQEDIRGGLKNLLGFVTEDEVSESIHSATYNIGKEDY